MFGNVELGHGRQTPWGPQAVVIAQSGEVQLTTAELTSQVPLHTGQVVLLCGDMESLDHHLGCLIWRKDCQQLPPQLPPTCCGQQIVLQLRSQQSSGLAAQALDHVAKINPPQGATRPRTPVQTRQGLHELAP